MKPICKIDAYENKFYYLYNQLHREDGPAIEYANGSKYWYINGKLHREDGPAIDSINGTKMWFYHDKRIHCKDNKEFLRMVKIISFL